MAYKTPEPIINDLTQNQTEDRFGVFRNNFRDPALNVKKVQVQKPEQPDKMLRNNFRTKGIYPLPKVREQHFDSVLHDNFSQGIKPNWIRGMARTGNLPKLSDANVKKKNPIKNTNMKWGVK